jgi:soluble cytochrome b562
MKIRILLLAVSLAVSATFFLRAEEPKKQPKAETELEGKMEKMSGDWRKLKRQVADATKNADSLQLLAAIRVAAAASAKLVPAKADDFSGVDRAKFVADFQDKMKILGAELEKLEVALQAGKNDEAVKLVAEIGATQKAGHKEFKRPEDKK